MQTHNVKMCPEILQQTAFVAEQVTAGLDIDARQRNGTTKKENKETKQTRDYFFSAKRKIIGMCKKIIFFLIFTHQVR